MVVKNTEDLHRDSKEAESTYKVNIALLYLK